MLEHKKASSELLSIWWFFVLAIIAVGIVSGVVIFYGAKIDVRSIEAQILTNKIGDCLIQNGELKFPIFEKNNDLFQFCSLNKEMLNNSGNYYLHILAKKANEEVSLAYGNSGFEKDCAIAEAMKAADNYPRCSKKHFSGFNDKMELVTIEVNTGSNYLGGK
jgi:hypothetical protein